MVRGNREAVIKRERKMSSTQLLAQYSRMLSSTGKTRTLYLHFAGDFLDYADGDFSKETINKYLEHLRRKHKYSDGSINFAFRVIRTLFSRNNLEWPYRRGESPSIREGKVQAPALHPNTIIRMIQAVKEKGEPDEKAFFALSTTYGLRRTEMLRLSQLDVRIKDRSIHIATANQGQERYHLIPEEIIPYLKQRNFDNNITEFALLVLWYRIEHRIGLKHIDRVGWESVKRTLNTLLLRQLPALIVMSFLRWKQRTSPFMPYRYSAVKFVGEEGESIKGVGEALDVDNEVFKAHPFIEYWR